MKVECEGICLEYVGEGSGDCLEKQFLGVHFFDADMEQLEYREYAMFWMFSYCAPWKKELVAQGVIPALPWESVLCIAPSACQSLEDSY